MINSKENTKLSSPKQRQLIGIYRKLLNLDEDIYKEMLGYYGVESSKELFYSDAQELLNNLKNKVVELRLYKPKENLKYENMSYRHNMATPKQLRYLEALWVNISNQPTLELKQKALNHFVKTITKKDHIKFLNKNDVSKVIKAIETMKKQGNIKNNKEDKYAAN